MYIKHLGLQSIWHFVELRGHGDGIIYRPIHRVIKKRPKCFCNIV